MTVLITLAVLAGLSVLACWGLARARHRRREQEITLLMAYKRAMEKRPDLFQ